MNIVEKILARSSNLEKVQPGDVVVVKVETAVTLDMAYYLADGKPHHPVKLWDPEKVITIHDHISPPKDVKTAEAVLKSRKFVQHYGIPRFHDVGSTQGIVHQVIQDEGYALPGTVLVCNDSHTCSSGAFNCCARGIGVADLTYVLCTGETWFKVGETIRYELIGMLSEFVTAKDVFLYIAGKYGSHVVQNIEFGGSAANAFSIDARRTLSTMCAELSAEFAIWEPNEELVQHMKKRTDKSFYPTYPDEDAEYKDVRTIVLDEIVPYIALPDAVPNNTLPIDELKEPVKVDQCVVGSCANGTLSDLQMVAKILKGRKIAPHVRFIVTPGSQTVYREAARLGILNVLVESGCLMTPPACGACGGLDFGVLAGGETCLTATPRNFKGRMGSSESKIYLGAPATVAASAITGYITDPRNIKGV
jgi:3-isopropylmalate/(R)-2-methylmalate dehydratase large subunit